MERIFDFQARKTREIPIVGAQRRAVFNGQRGQMRVHDQRAAAARFWKEIAQDPPMLVGGVNYNDIRLLQPLRDDGYGLL